MNINYMTDGLPKTKHSIEFEMYSGLPEFARMEQIIGVTRKVRDALKYHSYPGTLLHEPPKQNSKLLSKEVCDQDNARPEISALVLSDLLEEDGLTEVAEAVRVLARTIDTFRRIPISVENTRIESTRNEFGRMYEIKLRIPDEDVVSAGNLGDPIKKRLSELFDKLVEALQ